MGFELVQIIYWISLSTWFGGVLFVAVAAPIIFRTIRENNPILPAVLAVNLENQHGSLLAGMIVGNILTQLQRIELICAGGTLLGIVAQWFMTDLSGQEWLLPMLRSAMWILAVGVLIYLWLVLWPRISEHREQYIEHADEPDIANPAKEQFDRLHKESVTLLTVRLALLLGMILFSASISQKRAKMPLPGTASIERIDRIFNAAALTGAMPTRAPHDL